MRILKIAFLGAFVSLFTLSCEDDSSRYSDVDQLSDFAKNYLQMKASPGMNASTLSQPGNPVNESFQRLYSSSGRSSGRTNDSTSTDTVFVAPLWVTCANISVINHADGSVTTIYDYGDGCEEGNEYYSYFMHGKYSYTYKSDIKSTGFIRKEDFQYQYQSQNYGGRYYYNDDTVSWSSNGASDYSGHSTYDESKNTYSGSFSYNVDDMYTYDGVSYSYTGSSKSSYDEKRHVTEESTFTSAYGENYYHSLVLEPLVIRYNCDASRVGGGAMECMIWLPMYVSGREFIKYKQDGQEGSFVIDWGNGLCDSKFTIEENGKYYKIDWANAETVFTK